MCFNSEKNKGKKVSIKKSVKKGHGSIKMSLKINPFTTFFNTLKDKTKVNSSK